MEQNLWAIQGKILNKLNAVEMDLWQRSARKSRLE